MVDILCPHCDEEIELDDDASGEFACPLCDGVFEWNLPDENEEVLVAEELNNGTQPTQAVYVSHQVSQKSSTPALIFSVIVFLGALVSMILPFLGFCNILLVIPAYIYASGVKNSSAYGNGFDNIVDEKQKNTARMGWMVANAALILTIIAIVLAVMKILFFAEAAADTVSDYDGCINLGGSC